LSSVFCESGGPRPAKARRACFWSLTRQAAKRRRTARVDRSFHSDCQAGIRRRETRLQPEFFAEHRKATTWPNQKDHVAPVSRTSTMAESVRSWPALQRSDDSVLQAGLSSPLRVTAIFRSDADWIESGKMSGLWHRSGGWIVRTLRGVIQTAANEHHHAQWILWRNCTSGKGNKKSLFLSRRSHNGANRHAKSQKARFVPSMAWLLAPCLPET